MNPCTEAMALRTLHEALGPIAPGHERILRPTADGPMATERRDGLPPRVHTLVDGGVVELRPEHDAGLPGASLLADTEALAALLSPVVGRPLAADLVAWRPGRRAVLRVMTGRGIVWLKLLDVRSWRRAQRAFAALGETLAPVQLARPLALLPEVAGYLAPHAAGTCLRDAGTELSTTTLVRSVMALAYTQILGELPTFDFAAARAAAVKSLQQAAGLRPDLAGLTARVRDLVAPAPPTRPGFVHGDLHDKQLFVDGTTTTLIDLEGAAAGDSRFDAVNLAEHLRLRELQSGTKSRGIADHLLMRCALHPDDLATVAFRAVVRARLCGVYALRPRWQLLVDQLCTETMILLERLP